MVLADQILGEVVELATAVGMTLTSEPIPDWLTTTIYQPRNVTPDWPDRLAAFANVSDRQQTATCLAAEAQLANDAMRAVFRLGYLLPCVPMSDLRATLLGTPLLAGFPDGVRLLLAELFDGVVAATPNPSDVPTLFPRRVREWIAAHEERLAR